MTLPTLENWKKNIPDSFKVQYSKQTRKKGNKKNNKRKAKKAGAKRMEVNCKRVIETIAPQKRVIWCYRACWSIISSLWRNKWAPQNTKAIYPICLWEGIVHQRNKEQSFLQLQDIIKQYLCFNLNENHNDDESDCINADDIIMMIKIHVLTAALMVMLKTVMNRIAKTLITLITISFIISIRLYSIVINEK